MVKRYTPEAKISYSTTHVVNDEALVKMDKNPEGEFVKYEAYRNLLKKYEKLKYGDICIKVAKHAKLTPEETQKRVVDFCMDHYAEFNFYPGDMEVEEGVVINYEKMMDILENFIPSELEK